MSSSFWLLGVDPRDFSYAEKERTACKVEQIHKMTIIFTENSPRLSFRENLFSFASSSFFLSLKSDVTQLATAKN